MDRNLENVLGQNKQGDNGIEGTTEPWAVKTHLDRDVAFSLRQRKLCYIDTMLFWSHGSHVIYMKLLERPWP